MEEIWKDIPGYEGKYKVSNMGKVFSYLTNRELTPQDDKGYYRITLSYDKNLKRYNVHRLVLKSFIGESELVINHIDGNPKNNRLDNLEYCTQKENIAHAFNTGLSTNKHIMKSVAQLNIKGDIINIFNSITEAAKSINGNRRGINNVLAGFSETSSGYLWKYVNQELANKNPSVQQVAM